MRRCSHIAGLAVLLAIALALLAGVAQAAEEPPKITVYRIRVSEKDASGWYPAVPTSGSFRVLLPLPFSDFSTEAADPEAGPVITRVVRCKSSDGRKFSATETEISPRMADPDLEAILRKVADDRAATVRDVDRTPYLDNLALSFEVTGPDRGAFFRYVKAPGRLICLMMEFPVTGRTAAAEQRGRFFDSLRLLTTGAGKGGR
jgi:hypothetical protein